MLAIVFILTPVTLLLWYVRRQDNEPEPISRIWLAFVVGAILTPLIVGALRVFTPPVADRWGYAVVESFFTAGICEEAAKIGTLWWLGRYFFDRSRLMAWLTHGTAVGGGFAMWEDLHYTYCAHADGDLSQYSCNSEADLMVAAGRALMPTHAALTMVAGYFLSLAHRQPANRRFLILAVLLPVCLHGLNNFVGHALRLTFEGASGLALLLYASPLFILVGLPIGLVIWLPRWSARRLTPLTRSATLENEARKSATEW